MCSAATEIRCKSSLVPLHLRCNTYQPLLNIVNIICDWWQNYSSFVTFVVVANGNNITVAIIIYICKHPRTFMHTAASLWLLERKCQIQK